MDGLETTVIFFSPLMFEKKSYGLETRDSTGENLNISLLGMPILGHIVIHKSGHAFNHAFLDLGYFWQWSRESYAKYINIKDDLTRLSFFLRDQRPATYQRLHRGAAFSRICEHKSDMLYKMIANGAIRFRPGAGRLLREAHETGMRLALYSRLSRDQVEILLGSHFGFEAIDWFDVIYCEETESGLSGSFHSNTKNFAPEEVCALIAEQLGVAPFETVFFDARSSVTDALTKRGFHAIAVPGLYSSEQIFRETPIVLTDFGTTMCPLAVLKGNIGRDTLVTLSSLNDWLAPPVETRLSAIA
jgi:phosphoglycolate phosphatase-like HAD superfamily hydrolase